MREKTASQKERAKNILDLLKWFQKLYERIEVLRRERKDAERITNEKERLAKLASAGEKIWKLKKLQKTAIKTMLRQTRRMDLYPVLLRCWHCTRTQGHSGVLICENESCKIYERYLEFVELVYTEFPAACEEAERELKENEINETLYR